MGAEEELVAIVSVIGGLMFPIAIILVIVLFDYMKRRTAHKERMECIKLGQPVPFEVEPIKVKKTGPRTGFILTGLGIIFLIIGIIDFAFDMADGGLGRHADMWEYFWGLVVLAIGLALLLYHKMYGEADAVLKREAFDAQKNQSKIYLEAFTKAQVGSAPPQEPSQS